MDLVEILESLKIGKISVSKAQKLLSLHSIEKIEDFAKIDVGRKSRRGIPEVIFAEKKQLTEMKKIILAAINRSGRCLYHESTKMIMTKYSHFQRKTTSK